VRNIISSWVCSDRPSESDTHYQGHLARHQHCPEFLKRMNPRHCIILWSADWRYSLCTGRQKTHCFFLFFSVLFFGQKRHPHFRFFSFFFGTKMAVKKQKRKSVLWLSQCTAGILLSHLQSHTATVYIATRTAEAVSTEQTQSVVSAAAVGLCQ